MYTSNIKQPIYGVVVPSQQKHWLEALWLVIAMWQGTDFLMLGPGMNQKHLDSDASYKQNTCSETACKARSSFTSPKLISPSSLQMPRFVGPRQVESLSLVSLHCLRISTSDIIRWLDITWSFTFFRSPDIWWCEKVEKKWRGTRHNQPLHHKIWSIRIEGNPLCQKKNERTSLSTVCSNLPHQSIQQTPSVSSFRWILSPTWGSTCLLWSLTSLWHEIHHLGTEDIHRSIHIQNPLEMTWTGANNLS